VPPIWRDSSGRPLPTRPCAQCGAAIPITQQLAPRSVEWRPCDSVRIVNWCGHAEELLPSPWGLLPVWEGWS
jgi:hypothetical protein